MNINEDSLAEPLQMDDEDEVARLDDDFELPRNEAAQLSLGTTSMEKLDSSNLDLEFYASFYRGIAKIQRLLYVADHCRSLELDALGLTLDYVINSGCADTKLYCELHERIRHILRNPQQFNITSEAEELLAYKNLLGIPPFNPEWVETTFKRATLKLDKLDNDLKNYKNNFVKESIRRGHYDLGEHQLLCGDLNGALKCFCKPRDYCVTPKHVITTCLNVMRVGIYLANWNHVINYALRAESTITHELTVLNLSPTPNTNGGVNSTSALGSGRTKTTKESASTTSSSAANATITAVSSGAVNVKRASLTTASGGQSSATVQPSDASLGTSSRGAPPTASANQIVTADTRSPDQNEGTQSTYSNQSSTHWQAQNFYTVALSKLNWMAGLAELCEGNFRSAAKRFLLVSSVDHVSSAPAAFINSQLTSPILSNASGFSSFDNSLNANSTAIQPLIIRPTHRHKVLIQKNTMLEKVSTSSFDQKCGAMNVLTRDELSTNPTKQYQFEDANANYIISPNNMAWYAGLAALATYDRDELKKMILSGNSSFKQFLELEPCLREILYNFYNSNYSECLTYLEDIKDQLALDLYLGPLLPKIYALIRSRALIQFLTPFSTVSFDVLLDTFYSSNNINYNNNNVNNKDNLRNMEAEIGELIHKGTINAKIDALNKVLYLRSGNPRGDMRAKVLANGRSFDYNAKALIIRAAILDSGIVVKKP